MSLIKTSSKKKKKKEEVKKPLDIPPCQNHVDKLKALKIIRISPDSPVERRTGSAGNKERKGEVRVLSPGPSSFPRPRGPSIISAQKRKRTVSIPDGRFLAPARPLFKTKRGREGKERITAPLLPPPPPPRPVLFVDYSCSCGGGKEQEKDLPRLSPSLRTTKVVVGVKTSFESVYRVTDFDVFLLGQNNRRR